MRALVLAALFSISPYGAKAEAATVTIPDGSLPGSVNAQNAEGVFASLTSDFNIGNGP